LDFRGNAGNRFGGCGVREPARGGRWPPSKWRGGPRRSRRRRRWRGRPRGCARGAVAAGPRSAPGEELVSFLGTASLAALPARSCSAVGAPLTGGHDPGRAPPWLAPCGRGQLWCRPGPLRLLPRLRPPGKERRRTLPWMDRKKKGVGEVEGTKRSEGRKTSTRIRTWAVVACRRV